MSTAPDAATLCELQAALRGGAAPAEAVAAVTGPGPLHGAAVATRLGRSLGDVLDDGGGRDPATDLLLRCLALAERTGTGAVEAVEQALGAVRDRARLDRLVRTRTTQARGTAVVLAVLPVAVWLVLVALDPATLTFYTSPAGAVSAGLAAGLAWLAWRWMRRMTRAVAAAASRADPLGGGAAEVVVLVAVALEAGLAPSAALRAAAAVAPDAGATLLATAAARAQAGWRCDEALADGPLEAAGRAIAAAQRWGAPAAPALRTLAAELREDRRAAVEAAAERLQLALVFPTTLLTLPAFVLGVVPPLLWTTLR